MAEKLRSVLTYNITEVSRVIDSINNSLTASRQGLNEKVTSCFMN